MSRLEEKVAFVTGAASGIGRESALALAREGAIVVAADVDADGLDQTVQRVREAGGRAEGTELDVTDADSVRHVIEAVVDEHGTLDVAHNNAGVEGPLAKLPDVSEEAFDRVLGVDLKGVFLGLKHQIPAMVDTGGGAIVNTASVAGLVANRGASAYSAAKHGVVGLTKTAAAEFAREDVRVNAVCPGWTDTSMLERVDDRNERVKENYRAQVPQGRLGEPQEVAQLVAFLASNDAAYVNGAAVPIDGGWTAV
jgi:NAD(P)-dependent dehydrogenase (short-subunit alcohol dehydrogenase family)